MDRVSSARHTERQSFTLFTKNREYPRYNDVKRSRTAIRTKFTLGEGGSEPYQQTAAYERARFAYVNRSGRRLGHYNIGRSKTCSRRRSRRSRRRRRSHR